MMGKNNRATLLAGTLGTALLVSGCMMPVADPAPLPPPVYDKRPVDDGFWRAAPPPPIWVDSAPGSAERAEDADPIDDYRWIDTAEGLARAIGSAPPDFTFRFDGREAYAWVSNEGEMLIVEPSPLGVIQYYYTPRAAAPYLVRDVYESYAFNGPTLVAWYDAQGQLMMDTPSPRSEDRAVALHRRGREILAASYQRRWDSEAAVSYSSQVFLGYGFGAYDSGWAGGWQPHWRDRPEWRERRERRRDYERERRRAERLAEERRARDDHSRRFDGWRRGDRREPPPAMMPVQDAPATVPADAPAEPLRRPRPGRMEGGDAIQPIRIEPRRDRPTPAPRTASPGTDAGPRSATPAPEAGPPPAAPPAYSPPPPAERSSPPPARTPRSIEEGDVRPDRAAYDHGGADRAASALAEEAERSRRADAADRARNAEMLRQRRDEEAAARRLAAAEAESQAAYAAAARESAARAAADRAMAAERARQAEAEAADRAREREARFAALAAQREAAAREAAQRQADAAEARAAEVPEVVRRGRTANEDGEDAVRPD